jgi:bacillithiol synthase
VSIAVAATPLRLPEVARRAREEAVPASWYGGAFGATDWDARAAMVQRGASDGWLTALEPALQPAGAARQRLQRAAEGGVVVTTGQQPGLFGGPLYTWHKALTALALADDLERRLGIPVAPVFWAATDDSDLAEATVTTVSVTGGAETIALQISAGRDTPMSAVPVGDVSDELARLAAACGSVPSSGVLDLVRESYSPGATLGDAYVRLLRGVLEPLGIAVLDAAHPATRTAASSVTRLALRRAHAVTSGLRERAQEMLALGLRPQVRYVAGRTLVFSVNGTRRQRIRISEASSVAEAAGAGDLSPNVLLRPVVERCILPTVAYIGGPSEIAYFAQVSAVAQALDIEPPYVVPRWSGYLIEPHVQRALETLGVGVEELRDPHAVEGRVAREELPAPVRDALAVARGHAQELAPAILEAARASDLDIAAAAVHGAAGQLEHKLDRLHRRLVAAVKRRGSDRLQLLATARGSLFPGDEPQERALNVIPFLARYGNEPLEHVLAAAREHVSAL